MASDLTKVQFIAKRMYSTAAIGEHTRRDHPLQEMITRKGVFGGDDFRYVVRTANPQSVSGTFTDALSQATGASSKGKQFATDPAIKYCVVQIDGPSLSRLRGSDQSFTNHVKMELDGGLEEIGDSMAFDTYRAGNGMRGRISAISTNVITFTNFDDARNFQEGMQVIADDTITGASPRVGTTTVASVDEDNGQITLTSAAAITALAVNDYLFRQGDPGTCADGFENFFPLTAPAPGDSFRGVDRSSNTRRLAGVRVNDTSLYVEETIGLCAVKISQGGKKSNIAVCNPIKFHDATRRLNAKVEFQSAGGTADYGFEYIMIHTTGGVVKVYSDPDCPTDKTYTGKLATIECRHLDEGLPDWINDDGLGKTVRMGTLDAIEARIRAQHQYIVTVPGNWAVGAA